MGRAAFAAAVALPWYDNLDFPQAINEVLKEKR